MINGTDNLAIELHGIFRKRVEGERVRTERSARQGEEIPHLCKGIY